MTSLSAIESLLRETIGLDVHSVGRHVVEAAVRASMAAAGAATLAEYASMLGDERELERLIDAVAVPESSFFRDPGSFDYLREFVTREWRGDVLRVLSVPCAAGEEPYSIAMTLRETGVPFTIDAVDIRASALDAARAGIFRPSVFRNDIALAARDRCFTPHPKGHALDDSVRELVRFRRGNLLDPALLAGETFDVVFCKNLLIYFTEDARACAVAQLQRLMAPGARLFAGASELVWLQSACGLAGVGGSAALALKKKAARRSSRRFAAVTQPPVAMAIATPVAPRTLADARRLAGNGHLRDAAEIAQEWLRTKGPSDEAYAILGLVAFARRDDDEGRAFMERALYLNPENIEALTFLALERERGGDGATAALLRERARRAEASHA